MFPIKWFENEKYQHEGNAKQKKGSELLLHTE